ncbi:MAG TPA: DUF4439 domain-containing protein [Vicinamibacteria bacterium]|nr:DUF4439 domain-containing protein [Vicinamibacteria bacterium]
MSEPLGRRRVLLDLARGAGVGAAVLSFLGGDARAVPPTEAGDLDILNAALALEHQAIALYSFGLQKNFIPVGSLREHAIEFRGDHEGHRDTQIALSRERGGRPAEPLARYDFRHVAAGNSWIRAALEVEGAAQKAYTTVIPQIASRDYLLTAAFIVVDEVRHFTLWKRVLGQRVY